jgi:uncharacterized membrane protein YhhN
MIAPFLVLKIGLFLMVGLLYAEWKGGSSLKLAFKAPLSVLFVLVGLLQPQVLAGYGLWIVIGLVLCLVGDICLALGRGKAFTAGLVAFLLGHVAYVVAFAQVAPIQGFLSWPALIVVAVSGVVFVWLKPHLGEMLGPVLAYVVVISLMVVGAWAVYDLPTLSPRGPQLLFVGAVMFYLSDLFVARDRFVKEAWINRLFGLPLYYFGQFLLAFSIGMVA